jgi:hypothetical protein
MGSAGAAFAGVGALAGLGTIALLVGRARAAERASAPLATRQASQSAGAVLPDLAPLPLDQAPEGFKGYLLTQSVPSGRPIAVDWRHVARWADLVNRHHGEIPTWVFYGHIAVESGGRSNDRTKLDERGVMQIHPAQSEDLGVRHDLQLGSSPTDATAAEYSIVAGGLMYERYRARLVRHFHFGEDDMIWRAAKARFHLPAQAEKILTASPSPATWQGFRAALLHLEEVGGISRSWLRQLASLEAFYRFGHYIASRIEAASVA